MTSNRYAVQYKVGGDAWTSGQVYISEYGGTNASPYLSISGYTADTSMSFVSVPARASAQVQLRVSKLFGTPFGASDQASVRPNVKGISVQTASDGTLMISTATDANFAGEQFILWWNRSPDGGGVEGLVLFLNPPYDRPSGGKVKTVSAAADLNGDLSLFDTLDFEGTVAIGSTGASVFAVPANINNIFLGPGAWVQGKFLFGAGASGQTRRIYGPGVLDVSRFRYDRRACGPSSAFPDDGLDALSSSTTPAILNRFQIDGIVIADHNHAATDLLFNSTLNNVKTLAWNGVNGGLRLGNNTSVSNTFVRAGDDSLMVWGSSVVVTNATVWQDYNGGVVNLGWFDNSPGDNCLIDGLYVVKTDWRAPTNPSFSVSTLNNQNNAVIASLMVPGTKFGSSQSPLFRNIYVEDPPQVLLSLKILPPDCDLITLGGTCTKVVDLTLPSVLNLSIENLFTPASVVGNSIGFQTFPSGYSANGESLPAGYTLTGTMNINLINVFIRLPNGTASPLTSADAAVLGKLTTNGNGVHVEYGLEPTRRRAVSH
ncbi:MAG TPA: hypothetical protein VF219_18010 [Vicinamibacterales bacterium]